MKCIRGVYRYDLSGTKLDLTESFELSEKNTEWVIYSKRKGATPPFLTELTCSAKTQSDLSQGEAYFQLQSNEGVSSAVFQWNRSEINVARNINGEEIQSHLPQPRPFIFFPLMRIFQGSLIHQICNKKTLVITPQITQEHKSSLFAPNTSIRESMREPDIKLHEQSTMPTRYYKVKGGPYQDSDVFWINDEDSLLTSYHTNQTDGLWTANLTKIEILSSATLTH